MLIANIANIVPRELGVDCTPSSVFNLSQSADVHGVARYRALVRQISCVYPRKPPFPNVSLEGSTNDVR